MPHIKIKNSTGKDFSSLYGLIDKFFPFAKKQLEFDKPVQVTLRSDLDNANNFFGKTAYYDPSVYEVVLYTDNRHPKDIMRSLSHELVHHTQNCNGQFDNSGPTQEGYAQNDPHLREMEQDAFLRGNMIFRDWCDFTQTNALEETNYKSKKGDKLMNENSIRNLVRHTLQKALAKNNLFQATETPQESLEEVSETVDDDEGFLAEIEAELNEADKKKKKKKGKKGKPDGDGDGVPPWADKDDDDPKVQEEGVVAEAMDCNELNRLTGEARTDVEEIEKYGGDPAMVHDARDRLQKALEAYKAAGCGQSKEKVSMQSKFGGLGEDKEGEVETPLKEWYDNSLYKKLLKEYTGGKK